MEPEWQQGLFLFVRRFNYSRGCFPVKIVAHAFKLKQTFKNFFTLEGEKMNEICNSEIYTNSSV